MCVCMCVCVCNNVNIHVYVFTCVPICVLVHYPMPFYCSVHTKKLTEITKCGILDTSCIQLSSLSLCSKGEVTKQDSDDG